MSESFFGLIGDLLGFVEVVLVVLDFGLEVVEVASYGNAIVACVEEVVVMRYPFYVMNEH